jgi:hypothetical protein
MRRLKSGSSRTRPPLKWVSIAPGATMLTAFRRGPSSLALDMYEHSYQMDFGAKAAG